MKAVGAAIAISLSSLLGAACVAAAAGPESASGRAATVRNYDLGTQWLPDPGPKGPLPVRLRGVLGMPAGAAARPLAIVAHGRHGDRCPAGPFDSETWPCFDRARRSDRGLRHLVAALAARGMVAIAPDLTGAFTGGWGEPNDAHRWPAILARTLASLPQLTGHRPLIPGSIGILGHSLSGLNAVRLARRREATQPVRGRPGSGSIRSLFLLAPVAGGNLPATGETMIAIGTCDGDTGTEGRRYFTRARRSRRAGRGPKGPLLLARIRGANHNYFNRKLSGRGWDDSPTDRPACRPHRRPSAAAQRHWVDRAAADFFATTLAGARRPGWMSAGGPAPRTRRLHGLPVRLSHYPG